MSFSKEDIQKSAEKAGIDLSRYSIKEIELGIPIEMEHGTKLGNDTNVTNDDFTKTLQIVIAHLKEVPNYYTKFKESGIEENITVSSINGMGPIVLPNGSAKGSGDIPYAIVNKKRKRHVKTFEQFFN